MLGSHIPHAIRRFLSQFINTVVINDNWNVRNIRPTSLYWYGGNQVEVLQGREQGSPVVLTIVLAIQNCGRYPIVQRITAIDTTGRIH
jgi:hypothetical protein